MVPLSVAFALTLQVAPALPARDSVQIRRAIEANQARFERERRRYLPWHDGISFDSCDEIIGRYCLNHGDREALGEPAPDSAPVVEKRNRLIDELGSASRALPGDEWIIGQRVRYLIEAKRPEEAAGAAAACRPAAEWWCLALLGYAQHGAGRFAAADAAYDRALTLMPLADRCRWTDLSPLLVGATRKTRPASCEHDSTDERFWWLADPLYIVPGNERRTEHYSRWVMSRLVSDAPSADGTSWGDDRREILIRFGWPDGWSRSRSSGSGFSEGWIIAGERRTPQRTYEPPARLVEQPALITRGAWTLAPSRPRSGYVPGYAARVDTLAHQVAGFRRGSSGVIVAAYDLTRDSVQPTTPARAAIVFSADPAATRTETVDNGGRARGVLTLVTESTQGLMSLEVLATEARRAGRQRYWVTLPPAGRPAVSDILLLVRSDSLPRSLEGATPLARPSTVLPAGTVGLYWEVYGLGPAATPYTVGLTVIRESIGFFRRAARAIGLGSRERPQTRLGWNEVSQPGDGTTGSSLALDLSSARPGRYTIRLVISVRGDSAVTERGITIKQGDP